MKRIMFFERVLTAVVSFIVLHFMIVLFDFKYVLIACMSIFFGMLVDVKVEESKKSKQGFTLMELLMVMVIISVLAGLMLPALRKARVKAFVSKARAELAGISMSVAMAQRDCGYYVQLVDLSSIETDLIKIYGSDGVLQDQVVGETEIEYWDAPYLLSNNNFTDPWGRQYRLEWLEDERCMEIRSAGIDTDFNTEDDLSYKFF